MAKKSITARWVLNTLCAIIFVLFCIIIVVSVLFKEQYYETVRVTLDSRATNVVSSYFSISNDSSDDAFNLRAKEFVEDFSDKSVMEVWVIDRSGNVVVSSSGFSVENEKYPDYAEAKLSDTGKATWVGRMSSGEKVMALSYMLPSSGGQNSGAVRYVVSLSDIDSQLIKVILLMCFIALVIIAFVTVSGLFFVRSIVRPVKKINETAIKIVSHELRTPLTAIKGWGETILEDPIKDEALTKRGLNVIISESERLTSLVEELLDFSRMENGNLTMRMSSMDVLAELDEAVFVFKDRSMREGKELLYNVSEVPAPMTGDPNRIKQVFVNILDNSFKYTEAGGTISVTAKAENGFVTITIADTGCGIPTADIPYVTEKFYKANASVRGSGIGLAVVNEIVKRHNGTLSLNSIEGKGTTVTVVFPIQQTQQ